MIFGLHERVRKFAEAQKKFGQDFEVLLKVLIVNTVGCVVPSMEDMLTNSCNVLSTEKFLKNILVCSPKPMMNLLNTAECLQ